MEIKKEKGVVVLRLERPLAEWLSEVLESLARRYGAEPSSLDPKTYGAWYWARGLESAGASAEDREEMLRQSVALRGERAALLREWVAALGGPKDPVEFRLPAGSADALVAALNDHRLALAGRHDWLDTPLEHDLEKIADGAKRVALAEIHFLGAILSGIIEAL
jgi:hypothetical protein